MRPFVISGFTEPCPEIGIPSAQVDDLSAIDQNGAVLPSVIDSQDPTDQALRIVF